MTAPLAPTSSIAPPEPSASRQAQAAIIAAICAFALMSSITMLRPVRDEMGLRGDVKDLPWLFTGTFVVMLLVSPLFGLASARLSRRALLVGCYSFFAAMLMGFWALMQTEFRPDLLAKSFFIWASVYNLFVVSIFWSFMSDVFSTVQAKRLYGYIAAGASFGAVAGPATTKLLVQSVGPANLLPIAATALLVPILGVVLLGRWLGTYNRGQAARAPDAALGGGILAGLRLAVSSPLLLGLCGYFILFTTLATFLYLEQGRIVKASFETPADRTSFLASIDLVTNIATLTLQLGFTRVLLARIGSIRSLLVLPIVTLVGIVALAAVPTTAVLFFVQVIRRASDYAFARPARESLFTLVSREERYKAKNVIDTVVYRGGDMVAAWVDAGLQWIGAGMAMLAISGVPLALGWIGLIAWLGKSMRSRESENAAAASRAQ